MPACGPERSFAARSALPLARVAAGAARRALILERSGAERADCPVVLAPASQALRAIVSLAATFVVARGSGRRTPYAPCGRCVRTAAARMTTKCASRTDPRAGLAGRAGPVAQPLARHKQSTGLLVSGARLLGVPEIAPAGLRLPRRWVFGIWCSGLQHSNQVAGSGRRCVRRSGIKGEPAGRRTAAEPNAPSAWSHTTSPVSWLPWFQKRPTTSALGRKQTVTPHSATSRVPSALSPFTAKDPP